MSSVASLLRPDETIAYRTKRHWIIFLWPALVALLLVPILFEAKMNTFAFLACLPLLSAFVDYLTSEFVVTNKRVIGKIGFIRRMSGETLLTRLDGIQVEQGILGRVLNYGAINMGSGGSATSFPHIYNPVQVRNSVDQQLMQLEKNPSFPAS